jgi:hypothetical protein
MQGSTGYDEKLVVLLRVMEEFAVHDVSVLAMLTAQNIKNLVKATESKDD